MHPGGPLTGQMLAHILLMNVVAPGLVIAAQALFPVRRRSSGLSLFAATIIQAALLWGAHLPSALRHAADQAAIHVFLQALLFGAALWFWMEVVAASAMRRWQSIFALLVTAKLFCLLGVLFVLSPRVLSLGHAEAPDLRDQQLAGLMMIISCPFSYVLAGVILAATWLRDIEDRQAAPLRPASLREAQ